MTRKRGAEAKEDGDYDPYDSAEDDGQVKRSTSNQVVRSSRGRLVKVALNMGTFKDSESLFQKKSHCPQTSTRVHCIPEVLSMFRPFGQVILRF